MPRHLQPGHRRRRCGRESSYAEANAHARVANLGGRLIPTTATVVATLDVDWLVELEVVAMA